MIRKYPPRVKGLNQITPVRSIRFSPAALEGVNNIHAMLAQRWNVADKPSLSLLLEGVIVRWAEEMKDDPNAITELIEEIEARGHGGATNQFELDGIAFRKEGLQQ